MTSILDAFLNKSNDYPSEPDILIQGDRHQFDDYIKFKAVVHGRVQGVGFRFSTQKIAQTLDVCGIVRNEADGTVYIEAVGSDKSIDTFIERLAQGPSPAARVERVVINFDNTIPTYDTFSQTN